MSLYEKMYYRLFNRVSDAIALLNAGKAAEACELLKQAQGETEELYMSAECPED